MDPNIGQPCWKRYESVTDLCMGRALLALRRLCIGLHLISKITFWLTRAQLLLRLLFILLCMVLLVGLPHLNIFALFLGSSVGFVPHEANQAAHVLASLSLVLYYDPSL
ncbi:hypothetical protein ACOSQ4_005154 [Xanthoceras sorbifolium]